MVMRAPIGDMPVLRQNDLNAIRTIWPVALAFFAIVVLMCLMALLTIKCEFMILNGRFAAIIRQTTDFAARFAHREKSPSNSSHS